MKARLTWHEKQMPHRNENSSGSERRGLRVLEWVFLFLGLLALDCYIWVNTTSVLYQAYEDWAFDQTLRGLTPSIGGFVTDETRWLFGREREKPEAAEAPKLAAPGNAPTSSPSVMAPPALRAIIGRLEIPSLNLSVMVRQGADEHTLRMAVGHIPGTALPGTIGNVALAGHRDTFFRPLRKIRDNDVIELDTTAGVYRYLVTSTEIVTPRDVSVLKASGGRTLTLVTCYPFYYVGSAPKRFIVHAVQVAANPSRPRQPSS